MRKTLTLLVGLALLSAGTGWSNTPAATAQPTTTSVAYAPVPDAPAFLVFDARALTPKLSALVVHQSTDDAGRQLVVLKTTRKQVPQIADDLPRRGKTYADGTPQGGYTSFDAEADALASLHTRHDSQAAADYTISQQTQVKPLLPQVSGDNIYQTIKTLSTKWKNRYTHTKNATQAGQWLKDRYEELSRGKAYASTEFYTGCSGCGAPVVMHTIQGSEKPNEYVVIGGHYDSIRSGVSSWNENIVAPGADDNASSQGTMLEALRLIHQSNWRPQRTVVFFSYSAEEIGLKGSRAAANWFKAQKKNVVSHMNIDMTNHNPAKRSRDITITGDYTDATLNQFLVKLVREYLPQYKTGIVDCGYQCSDHAPWYDAGYRSTGISEPVLFPSLHSTKDTLETMGNTAEPSVKFAQLSIAYVMEVAKGATPSGPSPTPTPSPTLTPSPSETPTASPTSTPTSPAPQGGEVAVTNDNVDDVIAKSKTQPVIFIIGANWSGFTKRQLPMLRQKLAADGNTWTLAYVDGALYKSALKKFTFKNYPTVIAYSDGVELADPARFADGTRDQQSIDTFVDAAVSAWKAQH